VTWSAAGTRAFARRFAARRLLSGGVVALTGDLGAGKTVFVQGASEAFGIRSGVTSPTFGLLNEYAGTIPVRHLDLYRISGADEACASGLDEAVAAPGVSFIEWPERAWEILPRPFFKVDIQALSERRRRIAVYEVAD
jgi:tRNA threonylcarbamoyladenosine biosynthesis protein TsaE